MYQDIQLHMSKYKKNEDRLSIMSNLQPNCCLKVDFQKMDQYGWGKWLIHNTKWRKEKKVQGQKHRGRREIAERQIPSIKMLFKTNTKGHKHPSIRLFIIEQDTIGKSKKTKSVDKGCKKT